MLLPAAPVRGQDPPVLPLAPDKLAALMPGTLKGWRIKEAKAQHRYMKWIQSRATRVFERRGGGARGERAEARITITDTGRYPGSLAPFRNFEPGKSGNVEKTFIRSHPAIVRDLAGRGRQTRMLAHGRFIVELLMPPNYEADRKAWIRSIDMASLKRVRTQRVRALPKRFTMISIDELDPSKSRNYDMSITTHAEVEAILKQYEEYEEETKETKVEED